jgi:dihydrodipicolinate synthase/N-acetylneuraminate lyase
MAASTLPRGLILDLVTPLKPDATLDDRGLARLLRRVLPHVQGILLAGPCAGEGEHLPAGLREALLRRAIQETEGRIPLLVWVSQSSADTVKETVDLLRKRVKRERYRGEVFWVDTPLYYQGNRGLTHYYEEMADRSDGKWVLHNDPELIRPIKRPLKRENIRTSLLKRICMLEGVEGLIFSGSLERAYNYQKAVRSAPGFRIYDGEETRFLSHPSLGGIVSLGANLMPRAWQKVTSSSLGLEREEYPDRIQQIFEAGAQVGELIGLYRRNSAPLVKQALFGMGILESPFSFRGGAEPQEAGALLAWLSEKA